MMLADISELTMPESEWEDYACPDDCAEYPDDPDDHVNEADEPIGEAANWTDESEED